MARKRGGDANVLVQKWQDLMVAWRLMQDDSVSPALKLIPVLAIIYLFFPIDLIPDLLPVAGQLDDIGIILLAIATFIRLAPPASVARARGDSSGEADWIDVEAQYKDEDG